MVINSDPLAQARRWANPTVDGDDKGAEYCFCWAPEVPITGRVMV